jgi:hypothetical protein
MGKHDLLLLAAGFAVVAVLATLAILFPVYRVYDGPLPEGPSWVRRPLWDPPEMFSGRAWQLGDAELEQLARSEPALKPWIENRQAAPTSLSVKARPIFISSRGSHPNRDRNLLGTCALYLVLLYVALVIYKWYHRG